jgi:hypothetical protein
MRTSLRSFAMSFLILGSLLFGSPAMTTEPDYRQALQSLARDIQALGREFPQLAKFSAEKNIDLDGLVIDYQYKTHAPHHRGGWTSGVPNPNDDGIWFYLDFHDPDSQAQIHTQPIVTTVLPFGKKVAFMLSLEGKNTQPATGRIWDLVVRLAKIESEKERGDHLPAPPPQHP